MIITEDMFLICCIGSWALGALSIGCMVHNMHTEWRDEPQSFVGFIGTAISAVAIVAFLVIAAVNG